MFPEHFEDINNSTTEELIKFFNTNLTEGLSSQEVIKKRAEFGYNEIPQLKKSLWKAYLAPIFNFLILVLIITSVIIIILGSAESTYITLAMILFNSIMVIIQQYRAQKAIKSLKKITELKSTVMREGFKRDVYVKELVPGDIINVARGNKIPADGRVVKAINFTVNEAPLTGESEAIEKRERIEFKSEWDDSVYMGTFVETGKATILVTKTGINTRIGEISHSLNEMSYIQEIPLTKKLNKLGHLLAIIVLINLFMLIAFKLTILGIENNFTSITASDVLADSIIRAMNVIPVNLPLLTTLIIITGVMEMAKNGVIIKNLSSIEALGRVSVLCSDKTGTITQNEMVVDKFWINGKEFEVEDISVSQLTNLKGETIFQELEEDSTFQIFISSLVANNNAELVLDKNIAPSSSLRLNPNIRKGIGSATEISLLNLVGYLGFNLTEIKDNIKLLVQFPFKSELKRMTSICLLGEQDNSAFIFIKGAPEIIIDMSTHFEIRGNLEVFDNTMKQYILNRISMRAKQGFRMLGVAYKSANKKKEYNREEVENNLIFLGFLSIKDPPRFGVERSVKECKYAGIRVIMVTGDHPTTATTIASEIGILNDPEKDLVVQGLHIKNFKGNNFLNIKVFSRISPLNKEIIVEQYQEHNKIVAMTGDGINDALALKKAEIGIAMGIKGTDTAKETADMIISDDDFVSIVKGIRIGRGIFAKIRVMIFFFVCLNIMEGFIYFFYEFIPGFDLFSSNWQHIYLFTIIHGLISLPLIFDKPPKNIMMEKPKDK
ncbi:MAG: cation-translocating P-type ATPase, partial [Promethearchaeota archaeon]